MNLGRVATRPMLPVSSATLPIRTAQESLLRQLGLDTTDPGVGQLLNHHGDTLQQALMAQGAPLTLQDDGHGACRVETAHAIIDDQDPPGLPRGFVRLARDWARLVTDKTPAQAPFVSLLQSALQCTDTPRLQEALQHLLTTVSTVETLSTIATTPATTTTTTETARSTQTTSTTSTTLTVTTTTAVDPHAPLAPPATLSPHTLAVLKANESEAKRLVQAVRNNDVAGMHALLVRNPSLVNKPLHGLETILHIAAREGRLEIVNALLRHPAIDINARDADDVTPLLGALIKGHTPVAQRLLDHKSIDVQAAARSGVTAFYLAIDAGQLDMAQRLRTKGADINAAAHGHWRPLHVASQKGSAYTPRRTPRCRARNCFRSRFFP